MKAPIINNQLPAIVDAGALLAKGIEQGLSVDALEKLLNMRRELQAESAKTGFFSALSDFQARMPVIPKSKQAYGYKYADLDMITTAIRPLMAECGLSYTFDSSFDERGYVISCKIHHVGGHTEVTTLRVPLDTKTKMNEVQTVGSAVTYGKRYALCGALGITSADEDNDGHTSSHKPAAAPQRPPEAPRAPIQAAPARPASIYPDDRFSANYSAWCGLLDSGKLKLEQIEKKLSDQGYLLSEEQRQVLANAPAEAA